MYVHARATINSAVLKILYIHPKNESVNGFRDAKDTAASDLASSDPRHRLGATAHHAPCITTRSGLKDATTTIRPSAKHVLYAMVCAKVNPAGWTSANGMVSPSAWAMVSGPTPPTAERTCLDCRLQSFGLVEDGHAP
jgi:hypothetical protein